MRNDDSYTRSVGDLGVVDSSMHCRNLASPESTERVCRLDWAGATALTNNRAEANVPSDLVHARRGPRLLSAQTSVG